jgi:ATP-binding cassette subfamily B protein
MVVALIFLQVQLDLELPLKMMAIVAKAQIPGVTFGEIMSAGGYVMLLLSFGTVLSAVSASYFAARVAMGFGKRVRKKIFYKVQEMSISEFDRFGTSSLITRTTNDVQQIQNLIVMGLRFIIMSPIMIITALIKVNGVKPELLKVLYVSIPAIVIVIIIVALIAVPIYRAMQSKIDDLTRVTRENLTGVRVIRAFNQERQEAERFDKTNKAVTKNAIAANHVLAVLMPVIMIIMNMTTLAVYWFGSSNLNGHTVTLPAGTPAEIGDLVGSTIGTEISGIVAVSQYVMQIMFSLIMLTIIFVLIPRASASAVRINEVLDVDPLIKEPDAPKSPDEGIKGVVEFKDVVFKFEDAEKPSLTDISFKAMPGQTTALIGSTGSGKSTIVNLIERFFDINGGSLLIDGLDVREYAYDTLRKKIGFIPQTAILYNLSIKDNIKYGKPDAADEEVIEAAKTAQAYDFITAMPEGFDTMLSQGGKNLSGGQKQRLSIARALVRKAEIYIFDDSFSALDFKTDSKLREALKPYTRQSTVLIVAQRVSTVMDADNIIVLDEGKIVGQGTHQKLLKDCPTYKEIVYSQLEEEEVKNGK